MKSSNKQYFALKSSLPYLKFGESPILSREKFLEYCEAFLEEDTLAFFRELSPEFSGSKLPEENSAEAKFFHFETALRNALVSMRAKKKGIKAEAFLREEAGKGGEDMSHLLSLLQSAAHPMERERLLDKARWDFLEELELDHYADLDALYIYCRKLLILEKWDAYKNGNAEENLNKTVSTVEKTAENI